MRDASRPDPRPDSGAGAGRDAGSPAVAIGAPAPVPAEAVPPAQRPPPGVTRTWMPALQSLRGVAALWVVVYHLDVYFYSLGQPLLPVPGTRFGWLGVDLFFVLSAYLLGQPFFEGRRPSPGPFFLDRLLRVGPAYYVAFAAALATSVAFGLYPWDWARGALNAAFLGNFDLRSIYTVNPVFWTLAVEVQFYLLLPLLSRAFTGRRWPFGLAALLATSFLYRGLLWHHPHPEAPIWATFTLPAFLGHFALGLAAARLGPIRNPIGSGVRRVVFLAGLPFIALPPLLWIPDGSVAFGMESLAGQVLVRPLTAVGFALVVLATASGGWPAKVLSSAPLAWLGTVSYSLYLMHLLAITWALALLDPAAQRWAYAATYLAFALAAGVALHRAVEAPVERWRRRRKQARHPQASARAA